MTRTLARLALAASAFAIASHAAAAESEDELAKKLNNPVANLISVPLQSNWDTGLGPGGDGWQYKLNIQPVIPIKINDDWNLISRTILPVISQDGVTLTGDQSGIGDILQSFFFSPVKPTEGGWIWGAGPVLLLGTASDDALGTKKWGAGPTGVLLKQEHGWTYGALANHIWSFAGNSSQPSVNSTFLQPFLSFTTDKHTTYGINSESTYDWKQHQWTVPFNLTVAQLVKLGEMPVQFQLGYRYYAEKPPGGPDWGLRFTVTLLFPK